MPQSSIFGSHTSHAFIQQPEFVTDQRYVQDFGGQSEFHVRNLKRKETRVFDAGNFEINSFQSGPTKQKRVKVSWNNEDFNEELKSDEKSIEMVPECVPNSNPVCNSMVTHMTTSFLPDQTGHNQFPAAEVQDDVEMECQNATLNERPGDVQEPNRRKAHFYMYRCKPQYCIFH